MEKQNVKMTPLEIRLAIGYASIVMVFVSLGVWLSLGNPAFLCG